jgi:integrase/recombinase XerD
MTDLVTIASHAPAATRARSDAELLATWVALKAEGSPHTERLYARVGESFLANLGVELRAATVEDVQRATQAFKVREDGKPASAGTVATYLAATKSFLRFAHRVGYTRFNAGELLKVKAAKSDRAKRILQPLDVQLLIRAGGSARNRLLLTVCYYAGLRVSELASLTWGHFVEREQGRIQIAGLVGKGNKEREVLLPASVAALIREARGEQPPEAPVFVSREGSRLSTRMVEHIVKDAAERAGFAASLARRVSPHWLRHAHASHSLDNGAPVQLVQQTLGHASLTTTSIYAHAKPKDSSGLYLDETTSA